MGLGGHQRPRHVLNPAVEDVRSQILTVGELKAVMVAASEGWINPIPKLALAFGLRRGELLALRWQDMDRDKGRLTVARSLEPTKAGLRFKEPKTKRGRRTISLPVSAVNDMRVHWKAQQEIRLKMGVGKSPPKSLVFCDPRAASSSDGLANLGQGNE